MWAVVAGVAWTVLVLLLGLYVGRAMARADRRTEDARGPQAPASTGGTRAEGPQPTAPGGSPPEVNSSASQSA